MAIDTRTKEQKYDDALKKTKQILYAEKFNNQAALDILEALVGERGVQNIAEEFYRQHPGTLAKDVAKEAAGIAKDYMSKGFTSAVRFAKKNLKK